MERIKDWEGWEERPLIDDPLAWQARLDATPGTINTWGAGRFWKTAQARGLPVVYRNGSPDLSEIIFDLGEGVGLRLTVEEGTLQMAYRFVRLEDFKDDWGWMGEEKKSAPASSCRNCRKFIAVKDGWCLLCLATGGTDGRPTR